ncbi:MAG: FAD-dependent oxidoreductase, partial [Gammaproteobacteria bacterium]
MHHVIIGAGPAGVVAAETLRKADCGAKITIVGDEPEAPYSRMALPYYLVGSIKEEGTHLRKTASHFADN